jgi:5'-nucleotidase
MKILLTNDDGIHAVGLRSMHAALKKAGHEVFVVAPMTEQSAVGHAVTMAMPLKVKQFAENGFAGRGVSGTPVDCVKLALSHLLRDEGIELVVSGLNAGANVGPDILYSGTVAAATEAALLGSPSMAASVDDFNPVDLSEQAELAVKIVETVAWNELPKHCVINVNFPKGPLSNKHGVKLCPQTRAVYRDWFVERMDPRGRPYYWLEGEIPRETVSRGTDRYLLDEGHATITPLRFDFTDREVLEQLRSSGLKGL